MARGLLILAFVAAAFWIYSIVDCAAQPPVRHRGVSKTAWVVIVVLLPVIGGLMWFILGRARVTSAPVRRAPDDDPAFFRGVAASADQDERIRRLEEELAQLDAEDDDPRWSRPAPGAGEVGGQAEPGDDDETRGSRGTVG